MPNVRTVSPSSDHPNRFDPLEEVTIDVGGYGNDMQQDGTDDYTRRQHAEVLRRIDEDFLLHLEARAKRTRLTEEPQGDPNARVSDADLNLAGSYGT